MAAVRQKSQEALRRVLDYMCSRPNWKDFLFFTEPIRLELSLGYSYSALNLYSFKKNGTTYWMQHREFEGVMSHSYFAADGKIGKADLYDALSQFNSEHPIFFDENQQLLAGNEEIMLGVIDYARVLRPSTVGFYPCYRYYMTDEQKQLMLEAKIPTLPEGYEIGSVREDECHILVNNWKHSEPKEIIQTRNKVRHFPSSCVRFNEKIVAHEITESIGNIANQFVDEEHRGCGLGKAVEIDISQKLIRIGQTPFKHVEFYNSDVIKMSDRSKYWTRAKNENGSNTFLMSLVRENGQEALRRMLDYMCSKPNWKDFLFFTEPIRLELSLGYSYSALNLYSFEKNGTTYWMQHREFEGVMSHSYFAHDGTICKADLYDALSQFNSEHPIFFDENQQLLAGNEEIMLVVIDYAREIRPSYIGFTPSCRYYMTDEQKELMLDAKIPTLLEGYEIGNVREDECHILVNNWRHAEPKEIIQMRNKVRHYPSSCVRFTGKIVAHEIMESIGNIANQFVDEEHRGCGLGKAVEIDISQKLIRIGQTPFKHVEFYNSDVIKMSDRSKYWTRAKNENGSNTVIQWAILNDCCKQ